MKRGSGHLEENPCWASNVAQLDTIICVLGRKCEFVVLGGLKTSQALLHFSELDMPVTDKLFIQLNDSIILHVI